MTLAYDPGGRLRQTVAGGATTQFLSGGNALLAEYNGAGTLLRRYVHGPGIDEPLVWYEGAGLTDRRYLIAGRQGSIIAANGASTTRYTYGPYGEPDAWAGSRFRYTGQIALPEVALYHYKARAYDPVLGRFLQTDPVGYADQMNLYAYVGNDPMNKSDPSGEIAFTFGGEVQGNIGGVGGGVSLKVGFSITGEGAYGLPKLQVGILGGGKFNSSVLALQNPNASLFDKAASVVGSAVANTGVTAVAEVGAFVGSDANPANLSDLIGPSAEFGVAGSQRALAKLAGAGKSVINRASPFAVSGDVVTSLNSDIKGFEGGLGLGVGASADVTETVGVIATGDYNDEMEKRYLQIR